MAATARSAGVMRSVWGNSRSTVTPLTHGFSESSAVSAAVSTFKSVVPSGTWMSWRAASALTCSLPSIWMSVAAKIGELTTTMPPMPRRSATAMTSATTLPERSLPTTRTAPPSTPPTRPMRAPAGPAAALRAGRALAGTVLTVPGAVRRAAFLRAAPRAGFCCGEGAAGTFCTRGVAAGPLSGALRVRACGLTAARGAGFCAGLRAGATEGAFRGLAEGFATRVRAV